MPQLLAIAEYITKTLAICVVCGDPANHTQRLVASSDRVLRRRDRPLRGALPALLRSDAGGASNRRSGRSRGQRVDGVSRSLLGVGFLGRQRAAVLIEYVALPAAPAQRRCSPGRARKPPYYGMTLAIGVVLGLLVVYKVAVLAPAGVRRDDDVRLLRATCCRSAGGSAAASTRTASGPTRPSFRTTRSAASAGARASTT